MYLNGKLTIGPLTTLWVGNIPALSNKYFFIPKLSAFYVCLPSAAYIQVYLRQDFIMEANTKDPDQTASKGAVWSGSILFAIRLT